MRKSMKSHVFSQVLRPADVALTASVVLLVAALAGCGGGGSSTPDASDLPDGPAAADAPPTADAPAPPDAPPDAPPAPDAPPPPDAPPAVDAAPPDAPPAVDAAPPDAPGAAGTCATPTGLAAGVQVSGMTSGSSTTDPNEPSPCGSANGPEAVYSFYLDHTADLVFTVVAAFDGVIYIRSDCDGVDAAGTNLPDPACDDEIGTNKTEIAELRDAAPGTYYLIVDGYSTSSSGSFTAELRVREIVGLGEACDDVTARCETGLACAGGVCADVATACMINSAGELSPGVQVSGDRTGKGNHTTCSGSGLGEDEYWTFVADADGGTYRVEATGSPDPVLIYYMTDCTNTSTATSCTGPGLSKTFDVDLGPNEIIYVVVDGYSGDTGPYTLKVSPLVVLAPGDSCDPASTTVLCPAGTFCSSTSMTCASLCGNGILDPGEQCDDGNTNTGDGCSDNCGYEGTFTLASESEPNGDTTTAGSTAPPTIIGGNIDPSGDLDYYKVSLGAGETFVASVIDGPVTDCKTNQLDSLLQVWEAGGTSPLTLQEDITGHYCSSLSYTSAAGGSFYVVVRATAFNTAATFDYNLEVQVPALTPLAEIEPNASQAESTPIDAGVRVSGAIAGGDVDYYSLKIPAGYRLVAEVTDGATAKCADGTLDSKLALYKDGATSAVTTKDNITGTSSKCSRVAYSVPTNGTYHLAVSAGLATPSFDYTLIVTLTRD